MTDFDDFLNSIGFGNETETSLPQTTNTSPEESPVETTVYRTLNSNDMDNILAEYGIENLTTEPLDLVNTPVAEQIIEEIDDVQNIEIIEDTLPEEPQHDIIPLNSPTLNIDDSTSRFSGTEWYEKIQKQRVIIAGVGGIGSNLAFQLSRMHLETLCMYDDDNVELANMSGQLFSRKDVGKPKVTAMSDMIASYTSTSNVYGVVERFTSNTPAGNVMMCGFDNMEARKTFFNAWLEHIQSPNINKEECLFLDGRLSIDTLQILCIRGIDEWRIQAYKERFLFSDAEADNTVCSMKQTTYMACMIASFMTNLFTNWVANSLEPFIPYDLPFFTEYDSKYMMFNFEK